MEVVSRVGEDFVSVHNGGKVNSQLVEVVTFAFLLMLLLETSDSSKIGWRGRLFYLINFIARETFQGDIEMLIKI